MRPGRDYPGMRVRCDENPIKAMFLIRYPQCGVSAQAPAPGKYRCPRCQAVLAVPEPDPERRPGAAFADPEGRPLPQPPELPRIAGQSSVRFARKRSGLPSLPPLPVMLVMGFAGVVGGLIFSLAIEPFMGIIPTMLYLPILVFGSGWFAIFCCYRLYELRLARYRLIVVLFGLSMATCGWFAGSQYEVDVRRVPETPFVNPWTEKHTREASMMVVGGLLGLSLGCFLGLKTAEYIDRLEKGNEDTLCRSEASV